MIQKRRTHKRPMKSAAFRFDERVYLQFQSKAAENGMSCVEALEHLMKLAVGGQIDLSSFEPTEEVVVLQEATEAQRMMIFSKLQWLSGSDKFIPTKSKIDNCFADKKPLVIRFPKFRVSITKSKSGDVSIEVIENNKIRAVIDGANAEIVLDKIYLKSTMIETIQQCATQFSGNFPI